MIPLEDVFCPCCQDDLTSAVGQLPHVVGVHVDLERRVAHVTVHPGLTDAATLRRQIADCNFLNPVPLPRAQVSSHESMHHAALKTAAHGGHEVKGHDMSDPRMAAAMEADMRRRFVVAPCSRCRSSRTPRSARCFSVVVSSPARSTVTGSFSPSARRRAVGVERLPRGRVALDRIRGAEHERPRIVRHPRQLSVQRRSHDERTQEGRDRSAERQQSDRDGAWRRDPFPRLSRLTTRGNPTPRSRVRQSLRIARSR